MLHRDGAARILFILALSLGPLSIPAARPQERAPGEEAGRPAAVEALAAGRAEKGERNIAGAEARFQEALAAAERGGEVYEAALDELTYHLPLMRVERYVLTGQWRDAQQALEDLLDRHQSDEQKSRHLVGLIAKLRDHAPGQHNVSPRDSDGRKVLERIERTLDRFLAEHGRYPRDYAELNAILPAGRFPLENHDIVDYVGRGRAYGLTLRSRTDPASLLSVQRTGLLQ